MVPSSTLPFSFLLLEYREAIAELRKLLQSLQDQQPRVNTAELVSTFFISVYSL